MVSCFTLIEAHKDFFVAIGALLSPFAAVFVGLMAARWQAASLLKSTRMQIRASALRDYRQRNVEKLREEIAAEIFYVSELRFKQQEIGLHDPRAQQIVFDAMARKIRMRALQSAASGDQLQECFRFEERLIDDIKSRPAARPWSDGDNASISQKVDTLGNLYLKVLESEMRAATESAT
jgi:hypothetical protein